ncbi:hypothetical protein Sjap_023410 [Stephania japonica]|uniref:Cytochrome P450 n=1 Tax=Stephania japonica TaxID=461633 RepID=A0AAP0EIT6_9MAGN
MKGFIEGRFQFGEGEEFQLARRDGPFAWIPISKEDRDSSRLHITFTELAKHYGPLMMMKFALVNPFIIISNHKAAMEVLKHQDRILSGRYPPHSVQVPGYFEHSLVFKDSMDETWKMLRKLWKMELFSTKNMDSLASIREEKAMELVGFLRRKRLGQVVELKEMLLGCVMNILGCVMFSQDLYEYEEKGGLVMKDLVRELMTLANTPNLSDYYTFLRGFVDMHGLRRKTGECVKRLNESWAGIVEERRATGDHSRNDFLDVLIQANMTDPQIDALFLEMLGAGTESSTCTIEWAMSELIKNPDKLFKLEDELNKVIGRREVKESDLENLHYLHACIKETFRLHSPVTLLIPHRATETCQVMNYTIPKNSQILVNTYAIQRDPDVWEDPSSFKPERFMNSSVDYQGNDFRYIPFGAGRRICPALSFASRVTRLILASLIHNFEWSLPEGTKPGELDMEDIFVLVLDKAVPLKVVPKARQTDQVL